MSDEASSLASAAPSRRAIFRSRLITTLVLWALVIAGLASGWQALFGIPIMLLALLGVVECLFLFGLGVRSRYFLWTVALAAAYLITTLWHCQHGPVASRAHFAHLDIFFISLHLLGVFTLPLFSSLEGKATLEKMAGSLLSFLYVAFLFQFVARVLFLPHGPSAGPFYVLYLVLVTKFSDMGAYVLGSLCGRHKMIPHISPGKTWEGLAGAFLGSFVGSFALFYLLPGKFPHFNFTHLLVLPTLLCAVAVIGDLAESVIKRCTGSKDSGHKLPGIGGVLDLIDSLLFTAPVMYLYMNYVFGFSGRA